MRCFCHRYDEQIELLQQQVRAQSACFPTCGHLLRGILMRSLMAPSTGSFHGIPSVRPRLSFKHHELMLAPACSHLLDQPSFLSRLEQASAQAQRDEEAVQRALIQQTAAQNAAAQASEQLRAQQAVVEQAVAIREELRAAQARCRVPRGEGT